MASYDSIGCVGKQCLLSYTTASDPLKLLLECSSLLYRTLSCTHHFCDRYYCIDLISVGDRPGSPGSDNNHNGVEDDGHVEVSSASFTGSGNTVWSSTMFIVNYRAIIGVKLCTK